MRYLIIYFGTLQSKLACIQSQNVADFPKILLNLWMLIYRKLWSVIYRLQELRVIPIRSFGCSGHRQLWLLGSIRKGGKRVCAKSICANLIWHNPNWHRFVPKFNLEIQIGTKA